MRKPLFASKWYKDTPANELRQEVQNLYRSIEEAVESIPEVDLSPLEDAITELDAELADYLPLAGGTLTGPVHNTGASSNQWSNQGGDTILDLGVGGPGYIRNGASGSNLRLSGGATSTDGPNIMLDQATEGALRHNSSNRLTWDGDGVHLAAAGTATTNAVRADRSISAGNGLTGGGNLTANRTLTLGTPGTISTSSTNSVSTSSHTHALSLPDTYGAVGTYVFAYASDTGFVNGSTYAGSGLEPAGIVNTAIASITDDQSTDAMLTKGSGALSGTWMAMGRANRLSANTIPRATLFLRIS